MATTTLPAIPDLSPEGNLTRYLQDIRKFPMLEPEEEFVLAKAWREHDDVASAFGETQKPAKLADAG